MEKDARTSYFSLTTESVTDCLECLKAQHKKASRFYHFPSIEDGTRTSIFVINKKYVHAFNPCAREGSASRKRGKVLDSHFQIREGNQHDWSIARRVHLHLAHQVVPRKMTLALESRHGITYLHKISNINSKPNLFMRATLLLNKQDLLTSHVVRSSLTWKQNCSLQSFFPSKSYEIGHCLLIVRVRVQNSQFSFLLS